MLGTVFCLLVLAGVSSSTFFPSHRRSNGDFVKSVNCQAQGMEISLKDQLPIPRGGMWDLAVEGYPKCPGATKTDVGGGHVFTIFYSDKEWCGVDADYWLTPAWVAVAKVVLTLEDDNNTVIADSVSCIYDTRFETSLLTFNGEIASENLRYGGSLDEDGVDVENTVHSSDSVSMDFFDQVGRPLQNRRVKLGDPIMFKIDVSEDTRVRKVLPENCYFSSSSIPEEDVLGGQTLPFVKKSCFNNKNGMVRAFLPQMERNYNGTTYEMRFPAFYFTGYSKNLFVHCTILACVGTRELCESSQECFGVNRRKRDLRQMDRKYEGNSRDKEASEEVVLTKYIFVEDNRKHPAQPARRGGQHERGYSTPFLTGTVCMETPHFSILMGSLIGCLVVLLVLVSCMAGRLAKSSRKDSWAEKRMLYSNAYNAQPPTYSTSVQSLPTITAF